MIQTLQQFYPSLSVSGLVIFFFFIGLYLIRIVFLFMFKGRILFRKKGKFDDDQTSPVSLILTVRNEDELLRNNLPDLLNIDSSDYEIIAVDDYSQDNTYLVLGSLKKQSPKLKISALNEETRYSYKLAQNIALKAANHDWVIPISIAMKNPDAAWLTSFTKAAIEKNAVIIGYETIERARGIMNHIYRIANFTLFTNSIGYILNGLPLIYSEENVAFRKQKYFEHGGYGTKIKEPFANLELVINSFIQKENSAILFSSESTMRKKQELKWSDFTNLLKKSYRIEKHISLKKRLLLKIDEYSQLLFFISTILLITTQTETWIIYTALLAFIAIAYLLIIKILLNRLREPKIFIPSLVYGILNPVFNLPYRWYFNYRSRKSKWRSTN